eukprot:490446-Pelagomonas_calceolata.AAC.2
MGLDGKGDRAMLAAGFWGFLPLAHSVPLFTRRDKRQAGRYSRSKRGDHREGCDEIAAQEDFVDRILMECGRS